MFKFYIIYTLTLLLRPPYLRKSFSSPKAVIPPPWASALDPIDFRKSPSSGPSQAAPPAGGECPPTPPPGGSAAWEEPAPPARFSQTKAEGEGRGAARGATGCGAGSCGLRPAPHARRGSRGARAVGTHGGLVAVHVGVLEGQHGRGEQGQRGARAPGADAGERGCRGARLGRGQALSGRRHARSSRPRRRGGEGVREAGSSCRRGREPLPGGRAQRRRRRQEGAGGAVRAPGRAHSSLCRSAGRARAARARGPPSRGRAAPTPDRCLGPPRQARAAQGRAPHTSPGHCTRHTLELDPRRPGTRPTRQPGPPHRGPGPTTPAGASPPPPALPEGSPSVSSPLGPALGGGAERVNGRGCLLTHSPIFQVWGSLGAVGT